MMPYIIILKVRKFHQPTASCFSTARKKPVHLKIEWRRLVSYLEKQRKFMFPDIIMVSCMRSLIKQSCLGFAIPVKKLMLPQYMHGSPRTVIPMLVLTSKSRVAPLDKQTVPRLELLSCLILSCLMNSVVDTLSPLVELKVV